MLIKLDNYYKIIHYYLACASSSCTIIELDHNIKFGTGHQCYNYLLWVQLPSNNIKLDIMFACECMTAEKQLQIAQSESLYF